MSEGSDAAVSSSSGASVSACVTPRPQQQLFKEYQLQEEIGSGGFGRVFRALRLGDGQLVVVKEIKTAALSAKQKAATMDEVQVLAKLQHPNIVRYHDCFTDEATMHIVMEYCAGGDLAGVVKRRQGQLLPEAEVMRHFVQILLALQAVHRQGILHRDLKTSNVLVTSHGLLRLGDFGVSKMSNTDFSMVTTIVGTPHYLSPEMCDNKPYGKKSDVWALGCVLCELCTLQKAFDGNSISKIILGILSGSYARPSDTYTPELHRLLESLLSVRPERRPYVDEILQMPYVRHHLQQYTEWAKRIPGFDPEPIHTFLAAAEAAPAVGRFSALPAVPEHQTTDVGMVGSRATSSASTDATTAPPSATSSLGSSATQQWSAMQVSSPTGLQGGAAAAHQGWAPGGGAPQAQRTAASPGLLALEQLEGIQRLRALKTELHFGSGTPPALSNATSLSSQMSIGSEHSGR